MHFYFLLAGKMAFSVHQSGFASVPYEILFCHLKYTLGAAARAVHKLKSPTSGARGGIRGKR
jgi:hypothetical protein